VYLSLCAVSATTSGASSGPNTSPTATSRPIDCLPDDCLRQGPYPVDLPWKNGMPASALQTTDVPFADAKQAA
jgi:ectoine hydroxylase